jgi:hypothetical protein
MKNCRLTLSALLLLAPLSVRADELYLKEGKVLHGHITGETASEYEMKVNKTMYLRIEKSKVERVVRDKPEATPEPSKRSVVKVSSPTATGTPSATAAAAPVGTPSATAAASPTTAPAGSPSPTPAASTTPSATPAVSPAPTGNPIRKEGTLSIFETVTAAPVRIKARTLEEAQAQASAASDKFACAVSWDGTPKAQSDANVWAKGTLTSVLTVPSIAWDAKGLSAADAAAWKEQLASFEQDQAARREICRTESDGLARALSVLRLPSESALRSESDTLRKAAEQRIQKKLKAHERRLHEKAESPAAK